MISQLQQRFVTHRRDLLCENCQIAPRLIINRVLRNQRQLTALFIATPICFHAGSLVDRVDRAVAIMDNLLA